MLSDLYEIAYASNKVCLHYACATMSTVSLNYCWKSVKQTYKNSRPINNSSHTHPQEVLNILQSFNGRQWLKDVFMSVISGSKQKLVVQR